MLLSLLGLLRGNACLGQVKVLSVAAHARVMVSTQAFVLRGRIPEMEVGWWEGAPPAAEKDKGHSKLNFIPDVLLLLKRKL